MYTNKQTNMLVDTAFAYGVDNIIASTLLARAPAWPLSAPFLGTQQRYYHLGTPVDGDPALVEEFVANGLRGRIAMPTLTFAADLGQVQLAIDTLVVGNPRSVTVDERPYIDSWHHEDCSGRRPVTRELTPGQRDMVQQMLEDIAALMRGTFEDKTRSPAFERAVLDVMLSYVPRAMRELGGDPGRWGDFHLAYIRELAPQVRMYMLYALGDLLKRDHYARRIAKYERESREAIAQLAKPMFKHSYDLSTLLLDLWGGLDQGHEPTQEHQQRLNRILKEDTRYLLQLPGAFEDLIVAHGGPAAVSLPNFELSMDELVKDFVRNRKAS